MIARGQKEDDFAYSKSAAMQVCSPFIPLSSNANYPIIDMVIRLRNARCSCGLLSRFSDYICRFKENQLSQTSKEGND